MNNENPKVFISYSWEDDEHKIWVKELADKLISDGIDATVDQYELMKQTRRENRFSKNSEQEKLVNCKNETSILTT